MRVWWRVLRAWGGLALCQVRIINGIPLWRTSFFPLNDHESKDSKVQNPQASPSRVIHVRWLLMCDVMTLEHSDE
jgi:hypothetical protein